MPDETLEFVEYPVLLLAASLVEEALVLLKSPVVNKAWELVKAALLE